MGRLRPSRGQDLAGRMPSGTRDSKGCWDCRGMGRKMVFGDGTQRGHSGGSEHERVHAAVERACDQNRIALEQKALIYFPIRATRTPDP
jgi:hypothetical protein